MNKRRFRACLLAAIFGWGAAANAQGLPQDRGTAGAWQALQKLRTTASAMHTTAHPDDEDAGLLTWLGRGQGVRVSLLTLNRGEGGDNAIGPELFDALGLIRTGELLNAGRYYGLDRQYFTTVADYGFSKRLDEAIDKWGRENVLRDMTRVIRRDRPFVLISRFQGNAQDGHGNHQAAGLLTREAFEAAGDPARFPEQIAEGLRPWKPLKLYSGMGFMGGDKGASVRVDVGEYSPWLGESYANFGRIGYSFHRSQFTGGARLTPGPSFASYKRVVPGGGEAPREPGFFDGIDTTIPGLFSAIGRTAPDDAAALLGAIDREVKAAVDAFKITDPSASVPALARGLKATREAISRFGAGEPEAVFVLRVKERQFEDAINAALAIELTAVAQPAGSPEPKGPFAMFAQPPVMGPVVPGQSLVVKTNFTNRGNAPVALNDLAWEGMIQVHADEPKSVLKSNETASSNLTAKVPDDARPSRAYYRRKSIAEDRYTSVDPKQIHKPTAEPALSVRATYSVDDVLVHARATVRRREANPPYGFEMRELEIVPAIAVNLTPRQAIVPLAAATKTVALNVELVNNNGDKAEGTLDLKLPDGWTSEPSRHEVRFQRPGERVTFAFRVTIPKLGDRAYPIEAVAHFAGIDYREGYDVIRHRDLETRYLYRDAVSLVRGLDVAVAANLKVGYVMGVGDDVPAAIAQLGAKVQLLNENDLAGSDLNRFDTIVTGTRAYAVREDLKVYNARLLEYVKEGGNLVILYNTQEFVPDRFAPFPALLPGGAEEVSEEDSPVEILAQDDPALKMPNKIGPADFEGWVEQRGSKFFSTWDAAYTPIIATHDKGQKPQQGGWLTAKYGKGHYTYFAYSLHRQLPLGVPGAYRLLANLLSLGKASRPSP